MLSLLTAGYNLQVRGTPATAITAPPSASSRRQRRRHVHLARCRTGSQLRPHCIRRRVVLGQQCQRAAWQWADHEQRDSNTGQRRNLFRHDQRRLPEHVRCGQERRRLVLGRQHARPARQRHAHGERGAGAGNVRDGVRLDQHGLSAHVRYHRRRPRILLGQQRSGPARNGRHTESHAPHAVSGGLSCATFPELLRVSTPADSPPAVPRSAGATTSGVNSASAARAHRATFPSRRPATSPVWYSSVPVNWTTSVAWLAETPRTMLGLDGKVKASLKRGQTISARHRMQGHYQP